MQAVTQILQLPLWVLIILSIAILTFTVVALRTGRELHFWPPSIGPTVEKAKLEDEIKRLQARLDEGKMRYSALQDENNLLQKNLERAELEQKQLQEKLKATWQPQGTEQNIGKLLALFDRQAMKVPTHEENFELMISSLKRLRIELQTAGVSTIGNPIIRELFEKFKKDLDWIERTLFVLAQQDFTKAELFLTPRLFDRLFYRLKDTNISLNPSSEEYDRIYELIQSMLRGVQQTKAGRYQDLIHIMTVIWFFASIDNVRTNILSEVAIIRRLFEQDI